MLAQVTSTPAGTPPAPNTQLQEDPKAALARNFLLMGALFVIGYFLLIRPQSKRAKEQAALLKTVKPGDKVVTSSGIVGVVVALKDKTVSLRSADTKMEVLKSAIAEITERGGESGAGN